MKEEYIEMYRGIYLLWENGIIDKDMAGKMREALLMSVIDWFMETEANDVQAGRKNTVLDGAGNDPEGI